MLPPTTHDLRQRAVGGIIACFAIALSAAPAWVRVWVIGAAIQVPVALLGIDADLAPATIAAAVGAVAVLPVVASLKRTRVSGHLGLMGHTVALSACAVASGDPRALTVAVRSALVGAVITVVAQVTRGSETVALLEVVLTEAIEPSESRLFAEVLPAVVVTALFPLAVGSLLHWTGAIAVDDPWLGVTVAGCAAIISIGAIFARRCGPVRTAFDVGSLVVALTGVAIAAPELPSAAAATSVALSTGLLAARPLEVHLCGWVGRCSAPSPSCARQPSRCPPNGCILLPAPGAPWS